MATLPPLFLFLLAGVRVAGAQTARQDASPPAATSTNLIVFISLGAAGFLSLVLAVVLCCRADRRRFIIVSPAAAAAAPKPLVSGGLDPFTISSIPKISYADAKRLVAVHGPPLECAICLMRFSDHEDLRVLPGCCHVFHPTCIDIWLSTNVTCPVCRSDLSDPEVISSDRCFISELEKVKDAAETILVGADAGSDPRFRRSRSVAADRHTLWLPDSIWRDVGGVRRAASMSEGWRGSGRWAAAFVVGAVSGRWKRSDRERESGRVIPLESDAPSVLVDAGSESVISIT